MKYLYKHYDESIHQAAIQEVGDVVVRVERMITLTGVMERTVILTPWKEIERHTCFCCSCDHTGDYTGSDPDCRNHGFDGQRPCEIHGLPGSPGDDGIMPSGVVETRKKRRNDT